MSEEAPKIGFYVCHCGTNIAGTVNVDEVSDYVSKLPGVAVSRNYSFMCSEPGQDLIEEDIREHVGAWLDGFQQERCEAVDLRSQAGGRRCQPRPAAGDCPGLRSRRVPASGQPHRPAPCSRFSSSPTSQSFAPYASDPRVELLARSLR